MRCAAWLDSAASDVEQGKFNRCSCSRSQPDLLSAATDDSIQSSVSCSHSNNSVMTTRTSARSRPRKSSPNASGRSTCWRFLINVIITCTMYINTVYVSADINHSMSKLFCFPDVELNANHHRPMSIRLHLPQFYGDHFRCFIWISVYYWDYLFNV